MSIFRFTVCYRQQPSNWGNSQALTSRVRPFPSIGGFLRNAVSVVFANRPQPSFSIEFSTGRDHLG
jgi:hypothetical protein